jgi:hypothetical protein
MLPIVSSCSSLSAGSCEARRPSNSAARPVSRRRF